MVLIVRVSRMMLLATLLAGFAAGNALAQTDWRRPGAQKEAICQGSCGGGCGPCGGRDTTRDDERREQRREEERLRQDREEERLRQERNARYDAIHKQANAASERGDYREVLRLLREMQKLRDGPIARGDIARFEKYLADQSARDAADAAVKDADVAYDRGDWRAALVLYRRALTTDADSLSDYGKQRVKDLDERLKNETDAADRERRHRPEVERLRAEAKAIVDLRPADALAKLDAALKLLPRDPKTMGDWWLAKAALALREARYDDAIQAVQHAQNVAGDSPEVAKARTQVADERNRQGVNVQNAFGDLRQRLAAAPTTGMTGQARPASVPPKESNFLYALQTRTLIPMSGGGHPIDAPGALPAGMHGLVGGTTWTFGFRWPSAACDSKCKVEVDRGLSQQLALYCASQNDPKCLQGGLPFTKENYDFVVSMGSSHSAIEDLATRAIWDGATFGEFSRKNKEIFASLKGRQFDKLDCHSNGAMLCLAALRSGETTAKVVRLFGPQINPAAATLWRDYAANTGAKIEIYINSGDPVAAATWMQPTPQTPAGRAATEVWLTNPITGPATVANALFHTWLDSKTAVMDKTLQGYGFEVNRSYGENRSDGCRGDSPDLACHSMLLYEKNLKKLPPESSKLDFIRN